MKRWISKDSVVSKLGFALVVLMAVSGIAGSLQREPQQNLDIQTAGTLQSRSASNDTLAQKPKAPVVETHVETKEEAVPYDTVQTYDGTLPKDVAVVRVEGADGKKVVKTEVKTKDGVEISRALISESITVPPVDKIVAIGTKVVQKHNDGSCDPHYTPCVKKTGHDIDCKDIGYQVHVVTPGEDPYDLDRDTDGIGCDTYPEVN